MNLTVNVITTDFSNETPLVVGIGGIIINGDSNLAPGSSHIVTVADGESATLSIAEANYHSFSTVIQNVYLEDQVITVLLVPIITSITDPNYNKPVPRFFTLLDTCSLCAYVYNASSFSGKISYFINNEESSFSIDDYFCFCNTGDYQIKIRNRTYDYSSGPCPTITVRWDQQWATDSVGVTGNTVPGTIGNIEDYLALDTNTNTTVSEYRVNIVLDTTINPVPTADEKDCYYNRNETITVTPDITLNRINADPALHNLIYTVTDPEGITTEYSFTLDEVDLSIDIVLEKLGLYLVTASVEDTECGNIFEKEIELETCNFVHITYAECNSYVIQNRSSTTSFTYSFIGIDGSDPEISGMLDAGESVSISLPETLIYIMDVDYERDGSVHEEYVFSNYCTLEQCISDYILDLLCDPKERCNPCPDEIDLNQMLLFYNTLFMKLNKLYSFNNFFSSLEDEQLEELTTIQNVMDKMKAYCSRLKCVQSDCSAFNSSIQLYDWMGKGSNIEKACNCNPTNPGYCTSCNES